MSDDDADSGREFESTADRVSYLISKYWMLAAGAIALLALLVVVDYVDLPTLPDWAWALGQALLVGIPLGVLVGKWVINRFFPENKEVIVTLDYETGTGEIFAQADFVPTPIWDHRQGGERPPIRPDKGNVDAIVTDSEWNEDLKTLRVEGANDELANPVSLAARQGIFEALYSDLLKEAERADRLEHTLETRALEIQRETARALLGAVETGSAMDPEAISRAARGSMGDLSFGAEERERARRERRKSARSTSRTNGDSPDSETDSGPSTNGAEVEL